MTQNDDDDFYMLGQMIGGYLNQDMDIWAESVPEAVAKFAGEADAASKRQLAEEMDLFLTRYHNSAEEEFRRRYGFEFSPDELGQTVPEFFAMTRAILADPECWRDYDNPGEDSA